MEATGLQFIDSLSDDKEAVTSPSSLTYRNHCDQKIVRRFQIHSINLAGLQTLASDNINIVYDDDKTIVKFLSGGNYTDLGLLQHLRMALSPQIVVKWILNNKQFVLQLSSKYKIRIFFNVTLGRKLGLVGEVSQISGVFKGYEVEISAGDSFTAEYPVDVHCNLNLFYVALKSESKTSLEPIWNILSQFYSSKPISMYRSTALLWYPLVNQNYQRFHDFNGKSTTFYFLDSNFQLLNNFSTITGRSQISLDIQ